MARMPVAAKPKTAGRRRRRGRRRPWWYRAFPFLVGVIAGGVVVVAAARWSPLLQTVGAATSASRSPDPLHTRAQDFSWTDLPAPTFPIPPYARYLSGVKIVLDPGHVGQRDPGGTWKRGPTGLREAEVNLRVAHFLRAFLEETGARVVLTREKEGPLGLSDEDDLRQRSEIANRLPADLLLSIHHNGDSSPTANYTTVFYHGLPDDNPASLSAGRHVVQGLHDALRLSSHVPCALLSDHALVPGKGFAVLRHADVPALLSEASFHSNPQEEQRLRDPVYNRREAYGLFLGLARWANAGLPRIVLEQPRDGRWKPGEPVVLRLDDGLSGRGGLGAAVTKILERSISAELDGRAARFTFDPPKRQLKIVPPILRGGESFVLAVDFQNAFGQHVLHPRVELVVQK